MPAAGFVLVVRGRQRREQHHDNGAVAIRRNATLVKHFGEGETIEIGSPKNDRARVVDIDSRTTAAL
jgi:hypothetical protein